MGETATIKSLYWIYALPWRANLISIIMFIFESGGKCKKLGWKTNIMLLQFMILFTNGQIRTYCYVINQNNWCLLTCWCMTSGFWQLLSQGTTECYASSPKRWRNFLSFVSLTEEICNVHLVILTYNPSCNTSQSITTLAGPSIMHLEVKKIITCCYFSIT